jgi:hypothetical protein
MIPSWLAVRDWAFGPADGIRLAATRKAMAWVLLLYTLAWSRNAEEWLTPAGFHPSDGASLGLQVPVPLLGSISVWIFLGAYTLALLAVIFEVRPRAASVVVLLGLLYVSAADRLAMFSMNKLFVVIWAVMIAAPWFLDREGKPRLHSVWPIRILQATLMIEYFGAGLCKAIYGDYLGHSDVLWYQLQAEFMTDFAAWLVRNAPDGLLMAGQWATLSFELLAPVLFCVRRLRPIGFAWGLAMHLLITVTMYQVGYFSVQIACFYILYMDDATVHRMYGVLQKSRPNQ